MKKKIIYLLFILCLAKIYYIADKNLKFSTALLIDSFKESSGETISLDNTANDVIPAKKFFLSQNIHEFQLSDWIVKKRTDIYQRMIEFNYPIMMKKDSPIFIAHKNEDTQDNCELLHSTQNLNIYECK